MNYKTSEEEIQVTQDMSDFFNENPEMMNQAAQKTIQDALSGILALAQGRRDDIYQERRYIPKLGALRACFPFVEDTADGMKAMMIARWINQTLSRWTRLKSMCLTTSICAQSSTRNPRRRTNPDRLFGADAGKLDYFDQEVRGQLVKMGATHSQTQSRKQDPISGRVGAPRPAQESVENQILRIDSLLNEKDETYDSESTA